MKVPTKLINSFRKLSIAFFLLAIGTTLNAQDGDIVYVEMAAIDQPFMYNRLGAAQPTGMVFALLSDLDTAIDNTQPIPDNLLGNVRLRDGKRPRPIVLRANKGNILKITFTNLLAPPDDTAIVDAYNTNEPATVTQQQANSIYPNTRAAGVHILGTEMVNSIMDDGSYSGTNPSSLVNPGGTITYTLRVPEEGVFMLYSTGATVAQKGLPGGQLTNGLFGTLNVQPQGAEWYRSQVTEDELDQAIQYYEQMDINSGDAITRIEKGDMPNIYEAENVYPIIDYDATFSDGKPIIRMYDQISPTERRLIYTDLTAIITGPNRGNFTSDSPSFDPVPASPNRRNPYREFGIHYHESPWTVQAFPVFFDTTSDTINVRGVDVVSSMNDVLKTGLDNFSINYGSGGIGAEIYANRIGVGPMADCDDCAYEEFFLSSWAVGDPATVVDVPANSASVQEANETQQNQFLYLSNPSGVDSSLTPEKAPKATKVLYPDDPSNVYHSYMNDHVKFRITHAGAGITHVHHQHAHQWLHSPNSDEGHYLDSQAINPGSSYTLEIVYNGSGNLNKTVGDQIFHCHFYPHFAQGMWSLWRVHDVLELGTELDDNGVAVAGSRALPDGEIAAGTAIPGLVPIPKMAMAPVPSQVHIEDGEVVVDDLSRNPGFPFYIPGVAGSRPPHPPMDFAHGTIYDEDGNVTGQGALDGGLPRSVVYDAKVPFSRETPYDWTKIVDSIQVIELPHEGTAVEKVAMDTHAIREHLTLTPEGDAGVFVLNGRPPVAGAPYADPAVDLAGNAVGVKRTYKAANIQLDVVLNKKGWHYPQQRIISLWGDVASNMEGIRPPEPFFFRASTNEYVEFWHTNLVPEYYELDDFQVRTPTDIIGQHIHLVKFDVTSSDGAANGFNYEDGTYAPDLVRERIDGINEGGVRYTYEYQPGKPITAIDGYAVNDTLLVPHGPNPIWGNAPAGQDWSGAQTTIQRWYADSLLNNRGKDRTLRTVFTHDHFSPSTHQQIGLYAGLLVEPAESTWYDPTTGVQLSSATNGVTRPVTVNGQTMTVSDGGPTGWQANIVTKNEKSSYREFMLEFQDTQQAYLPESIGTLDPYPEFPEDYSGAAKDAFLEAVDNYTGWMDPNNALSNFTYPELVSFGGRGTYSMNYRNEPIPLRVVDAAGNQDPNSVGGNLAYAWQSMTNRPDPTWNSQPTPGGNISSSNDFKFPVNPLGPDMGPGDPYTPLFRAYENDSIQIRTLVGAHVTSHFFNVHGVRWFFEPSNKESGLRSTQNMGLSEHFEMNFKFPTTNANTTDYLYQASSDVLGRTAGLWGLMRTYSDAQSNLVPLPNNDISSTGGGAPEKNCGCPENAQKRTYDVTAISIDQFDSNNPGTTGALYYNKRFGNVEFDALVFIESDQLNDFKNGTWKQEPLLLRASAGECVVVNLSNQITPGFVTGPLSSQGTYNYKSNNGNGGESVNLYASSDVALHTELLSYDVSQNDGANVGNNAVQTVPIGSSRTYEWYAGKWENNVPVPVEYGSVVLSAPDPMEQYVKGLFGALIIEPEGSSWVQDENSTHSAKVYDSKGNFLFQELVYQVQDNLVVASDTTYSYNNQQFSQISYAVNYKSEPLANRLPTLTTDFNLYDIAGITTDSINDGIPPETPLFTVRAGDPMRVRLVHPGGIGNSETFNLHGHVWQEEPYTHNSTKLGHNSKSQWFGFRDQVGPLNSFDLLIESAGGKGGIVGDYLYGSMVNLSFQGGIWGLVQVRDGSADELYVSSVEDTGRKTSISGIATVNPDGRYAEHVTLTYGGKTVKQPVNKDGTWEFDGLKSSRLNNGFTVTSSNGALLKGDKATLDKISEEAKSFVPAPSVNTTPVLGPGIKPGRVEAQTNDN